MKTVLYAALAIAVLLKGSTQKAFAADPDAVAPLVSYQRMDSTSELPDQPNVASRLVSYRVVESVAESQDQAIIISPVVSYRYFDWPTGQEPVFHASKLVSYQFHDVSVGMASLKPSPITQGAMVFSCTFPTEKGIFYHVRSKAYLLEAFWHIFEIIVGDGHPKTVYVPITPEESQKFITVEEAKGGFLSFPLGRSLGYTPYSAPISAVFDHSSPTGCSNGLVVAVNGETGSAEFSKSRWFTNGESMSCLDDILYGFGNELHTAFSICGSYTATEDKRFLFYDGHTGYDYPATEGTRVYAAADGEAKIYLFGDVQGIQIDHEHNFTTYYLHVRSSTINISSRHVNREELIGEVVGDHLHFTVKKGDQRVDPYGWIGTPGADPLQIDGKDNTNLWIDFKECPWK